MCSSDLADVYKKAIAYEFNALTEEYISVTFDDKPGVGGSGVSSGLSNAANAILGASATAQNVAVERAVKNANQAFNAEFTKRVEAINDGIEQVKVKAAEYADRLNQAVTNKVQEVNQLVIANKAEQDNQYREAIAKAGASSDLAKQAQNLATQVRDGLNKVKQTTTQAQAQVDSQIEQVKKDVGAIHNKQTVYEQSNEQNLARITGQLGDKASKAEVKQTADKIREEMSQLSKDADKKISAAKTTFEKTAEGLKTDMVAVKSYVANDGKRREELEKYSREETAKQIAAERSTVAQNYVAKSQYTEDVKGVNQRFEELLIGGVNLIRGAKSMILASGKWNTGTFRASGTGIAKPIDVTDSPVSGFNKGIRLIANGASNAQIGIAQDEFDCSANTYTVSWWVKGKKGQRVRVQAYWWNDDWTGVSPDVVLT